jgi:hypothetical protein
MTHGMYELEPESFHTQRMGGRSERHRGNYGLLNPPGKFKVTPATLERIVDRAEEIYRQQDEQIQDQ